jgi:hypothetical protein
VRTLRTVRDHAATTFQYPSKLELREQVVLEEENVRQSIAYARDELAI